MKKASSSPLKLWLMAPHAKDRFANEALLVERLTQKGWRAVDAGGVTADTLDGAKLAGTAAAVRAVLDRGLKVDADLTILAASAAAAQVRQGLRKRGIKGTVRAVETIVFQAPRSASEGIADLSRALDQLGALGERPLPVLYTPGRHPTSTRLLFLAQKLNLEAYTHIGFGNGRLANELRSLKPTLIDPAFQTDPSPVAYASGGSVIEASLEHVVGSRLGLDAAPMVLLHNIDTVEAQFSLVASAARHMEPDGLIAVDWPGDRVKTDPEPHVPEALRLLALVRAYLPHLSGTMVAPLKAPLAVFWRQPAMGMSSEAEGYAALLKAPVRKLLQHSAHQEPVRAANLCKVIKDAHQRRRALAKRAAEERRAHQGDVS